MRNVLLILIYLISYETFAVTNSNLNQHALQLITDITWLCKNLSPPAATQDDRFDLQTKQFQSQKKQFQTKLAELRTIYQPEQYLNYQYLSQSFREHLQLCHHKIKQNDKQNYQPSDMAEIHFNRAMSLCDEGIITLQRNRHNRQRIQLLYKQYVEENYQAQIVDPFIKNWRQGDQRQCQEQFVKPYLAMAYQAHASSKLDKIRSMGFKGIESGVVPLLQGLEAGTKDIDNSRSYVYQLKKRERFTVTNTFDGYIIYTFRVHDEFWYLALKKESGTNYPQGSKISNANLYKILGTITYKKQNIIAFEALN
ncbi:MAG: hypothetical protein ISP86_01360 [Shewanellaceae bacterium]|nr:hypothetical protein [Shewanellaceae bacterium]